MKLHEHPVTDSYLDHFAFPDRLSCQHNWVHGENPRGAPVAEPVLDLPGGTFGNGRIGHAHNDLLEFPLYGEITEAFRCPFEIKLFQVTGRCGLNPAWQSGIRDIVWDKTGSSTPPEMIGDPDDEVVFKGSLVVDPLLVGVKHGWWVPDFNIRTDYDNRDNVEQSLMPSVFVAIDRSVPERESYPSISARVKPHSALHREESFGENTVETLRGGKRYLPVGPLTAPYTVRIATGGYGAVDLRKAITELRKNADIHRFIPGTVLYQLEQEKNHEFDFTFDPVKLGAGKHSIIIGRRQETLSRDELIVTQLVFNVMVPGIAPPPPPVDTWERLTDPTIEQLRSGGVLQNRYRVRTAQGFVEIV